MERLCDQETRQEEGVYSLLLHYHLHATVFFAINGMSSIALCVQDIPCVSKAGKALQALYLTR